MIRSREYRLNEIADLAGFSSQSHFSRCFKQHFEWRRKTIRITEGVNDPAKEIGDSETYFKTAGPEE